MVFGIGICWIFRIFWTSLPPVIQCFTHQTGTEAIQIRNESETNAALKQNESGTNMARKRNNPYNKWMEIQPKSPPGRKNRKLLAHLSTLRRLHEQGYSVRQIEGFFKEAGVDVGLASVQREIKKLANSKPIQSPIAPESRQPAASEIPESPITPPGPGPSVTNITTPKPPTADEFFASYVDNPLLRRRRESSS